MNTNTTLVSTCPPTLKIQHIGGKCFVISVQNHSWETSLSLDSCVLSNRHTLCYSTIFKFTISIFFFPAPSSSQNSFNSYLKWTFFYRSVPNRICILPLYIYDFFTILPYSFQCYLKNHLPSSIVFSISQNFEL